MQATKVRLEIPEPFRALYKPSRYKVMYGGRGGARSWTISRVLLIRGISEKIRVLCTRELQNSIADSVHKLLSDQIARLGIEGSYVVEKARIYCPDTGTEFIFKGLRHNSKEIKSTEGVNVCWVEEAQAVSKSSWGDLRPTIREPGSEIWISFNPDLQEDETFQQFVVDPPTDAIVIKTNWRENPWFDESPLKQEMLDCKKKDYDAYLNIWEGHCKTVLDGAVYAKELRLAAEEGRICKVPYSKLVPVDTFWDIGRADATAIWFVQQAQMAFNHIDYYENQQFDITHYTTELQKRGYLYGTIWLPHDAKNKVIAARRSVFEQVKAAFPNNSVRLVPNAKVFQGIAAARQIFPNCYFDQTKCADGLHALRHYQYEVVEGQFSQNPLHNWASHGSDAFRYEGVALKVPEKKERFSLKAKTKTFVGEALSLGWMS